MKTRDTKDESSFCSTSFLSSVPGDVPSTFLPSNGLGKYDVIASSNASEPWFCVAEPINMGTISPDRKAFLRPSLISACVSSSPSKYLVASSSSASATASTNLSRAASTSAFKDSGISADTSKQLIV